MRGETERQATLLLGLKPDGFVPKNHPLRRIKPLVDSALGRMSPLFDEVKAADGRPSIPPEHLLKASLLMDLYTIRSERQFCEQLRYNILFKWFLDLNVEDEPFHATTFTKNRERLLEADPCSCQGQAAARVLLKDVVREARRAAGPSLRTPVVRVNRPTLVDPILGPAPCEDELLGRLGTSRAHRGCVPDAQ